MAATIRDHDLRLIAGEPGNEPGQRETQDTGYTIRAKAGPDIQEQLSLADWHLATARGILAQAGRKTDHLRRQAAELEARADALEARAERDAEWHKAVVAYWAADPWVRKLLGTSVEMAAGRAYDKAERQTTELCKPAVQAYADAHPELWPEWMKVAYTVNAAAVRKRLKLVGGDVVDVVTGEIIPPIAYQQDGETLTAPLLIETRPAGRYVAIEFYAETETDETEGDDDGGDSDPDN